MKVGSLCTGYAGLDMAVHAVLGGELAWVADTDPGASAILAARFPGVPNLGDITAVNWLAVPPVDVLTAGFPCQDVSCAGARKGLRAGTRTGVWSRVATAIDVLQPRLVLLENVRGLLSAGADSDMEPCPWCLGESGDEHALRALGAVLGDLADIGFDAEWQVVSAADAGAPHRRERVFILGWPAANARGHEPGGHGAVSGEHQADEGNGPGAGRGSTPEDTDSTASGERRQPAPGQEAGWRPRADAGRSGGARVAADAGDGLLGTGSGPCAVQGPAIPQRPTEQPGRLHSGDQREVAVASAAWGQYGIAIGRWERVTGRPAPRPTERGRTGERLSPAFVEWMQGLPAGWVTDVPGLTRNAKLKALGNGVVPQQAELALRLLLDRSGLLGTERAA